MTIPMEHRHIVFCTRAFEPDRHNIGQTGQDSRDLQNTVLPTRYGGPDQIDSRD